MAAEVDLLAVSNVEAVEPLAGATGLTPGPQTLERATLLSYRRGQQVMPWAGRRRLVHVGAVHARSGV